MSLHSMSDINVTLNAFWSVKNPVLNTQKVKQKRSVLCNIDSPNWVNDPCTYSVPQLEGHSEYITGYYWSNFGSKSVYEHIT